MDKIALIGSGLVGFGWGIVFASAGRNPVFYDSDPAAIPKALREFDDSLVAPGGCLSISLRHGPVPPGRRMFNISTAETAALAAPYGLDEIFRRDTTADELNRGDITWARIVFRRP